MVSSLDNSLLLRVSTSNSSGEPDLGVEAVSPERIPYEANERTVAAASVSDHLIQVTPHGVFVIDPGQGAIVATWADLKPTEAVLVASFAANDILLGLSGGNLLALRVEVSSTCAAVNVVK